MFFSLLCSSLAAFFSFSNWLSFSHRNDSWIRTKWSTIKSTIQHSMNWQPLRSDYRHRHRHCRANILLFSLLLLLLLLWTLFSVSFPNPKLSIASNGFRIQIKGYAQYHIWPPMELECADYYCFNDWSVSLFVAGLTTAAWPRCNPFIFKIIHKIHVLQIALIYSRLRVS